MGETFIWSIFTYLKKSWCHSVSLIDDFVRVLRLALRMTKTHTQCFLFLFPHKYKNRANLCVFYSITTYNLTQQLLSSNLWWLINMYSKKILVVWFVGNPTDNCSSELPEFLETMSRRWYTWGASNWISMPTRDQGYFDLKRVRNRIITVLILKCIISQLVDNGGPKNVKFLFHEGTRMHKDIPKN